jgi:hypothetical protein
MAGLAVMPHPRPLTGFYTDHDRFRATSERPDSRPVWQMTKSNNRCLMRAAFRHRKLRGQQSALTFYCFRVSSGPSASGKFEVFNT